MPQAPSGFTFLGSSIRGYKMKYKIFVVVGPQKAEDFLNELGLAEAELVTVDAEFSRQDNTQVFTIVARVEK